MNFEYKEIDEEGLETLESMAIADQFNQWMYQTIAKHTPGEVLEVGSGIGNITQHFLENGQRICASDIRENYCLQLKENLSGNPNLVDVLNIDLIDEHFDDRFGDLFGRFDSLFALNVLEHIEDDKLALMNCSKMVKPGGNVVILVPAFMFLYNSFDKALFHYRRYTAKQLVALFESANLEVTNSFYFNFIGMFGWFFTGSVLRKKIIPSNQMNIYNRIIPFVKLCDKLVMGKLGLSVVVVGKVKE